MAVAMLVAIASTLAATSPATAAGPGSAALTDGKLPGALSDGIRVPSSLKLSGRALASVLATVAERLEEDWATKAGRHTGLYSGRPAGDLGIPCFAHSVRHGVDPSARMLVVRTLDEHDDRCRDGRRTAHRRLLNLPPPRA